MMTAKQQELLSAFVDGELDKQELDELLVLMDDDDARNEFMRYQFSSDVLHGYNSYSTPLDLTQKIKAGLADDAPYTLEPSKPREGNVLTLPDWFWKQTAGLAAAASIGALAVVGVMNQQQTGISPQLAEAEVIQQQDNPVVTSNRWTVGEREVEDRLNNYLVDHNEYAGASGLFSYARVVSYGEE